MTTRPAALSLMVCLMLTGCLYYPITTQATDSSGLSSPYSSTNVRVDGGILSVQLADPVVKDADFRRTKLVEAVLITDAGRQINLRLLTTNYGDGVTFQFRLKDSGFSGDHFGLRITTSLDGKAATITGTFKVHDVGKLISWHDLDHG